MEMNRMLEGDQKYEAVGMGLTISKHIVTHNQGSIEVHSQGLDKGLTVKFTMKMSVPEATT